MSATGTPSAPCLRMNAFCASENLDAFIALRSSQPGNYRGKTLTKNGPVSWSQSIGTIRLTSATIKKGRYKERPLVCSVGAIYSKGREPLPLHCPRRYEDRLLPCPPCLLIPVPFPETLPAVSLIAPFALSAAPFTCSRSISRSFCGSR